MTIGRNDTCPCGSGNKYKNCCLNKNASMQFYQKLLLIFAGLIVVLFAVLIIKSIRNYEQSSWNRVWSEEHQHWHQAR